MSDIARNIRLYREQKNLSQQELAVKMRVGTKKIELYESGELTPDTETMLRLCTVLDLPASEILEKEYHSNKKTTLDNEIATLIEEMGMEKALFLLRSFKEISEADILKMLNVSKR
ncbi:XRE family transcriptional regulator [Peribacillus asahii]|uniref:XRE family transcriptional regulator n=1 Tax=Peribacillus asahii TaxID=228899 RepID=A0A398B749_9BACI|nr:helix-turn-helix transcriptional regulator [Peribacillus asahii]RID85371.1 XRE family transcriptional regulator [Peribacillus asahii]